MGCNAHGGNDPRADLAASDKQTWVWRVASRSFPPHRSRMWVASIDQRRDHEGPLWRALLRCQESEVNRRKFLKMTSKTVADLATGRFPSLFSVGELVRYLAPDGSGAAFGVVEEVCKNGDSFGTQVLKGKDLNFYKLRMYYTGDGTHKATYGTWYLSDSQLKLLKTSK